MTFSEALHIGQTVLFIQNLQLLRTSSVPITPTPPQTTILSRLRGSLACLTKRLGLHPHSSAIPGLVR